MSLTARMRQPKASAPDACQAHRGPVPVVRPKALPFAGPAACLCLAFAVLVATAATGTAQKLESVDLDEFLGQDDASSLGDCLAGEADGCGPKAAEAARSFSRRELCDLKIADGAACKPGLGKTRSMRPGERTRLLIVEDEEEAAAPLPSIDVEILFASGSDEPLPASTAELQALADAVADPRFDGDQFVLIGHTDAAGSDAYNDALSQRRAAAVRDRLIRLTGEANARFLVAGRGESDLKNGVDPLAAENRRVQVVLMK